MIGLLYTDESIAVGIKPVGMDAEYGLPAALARQLSGEFFPVHRLDTAVGGVTVAARSGASAAALTAAMQRGDWHKEYRAVVGGTPPEGEWEDLLFHDARRNKSYVVSRERRGVRRARLCCRICGQTEEAGQTLSLLALTLETGRTHQIRVQCASRGTPLLGDGRYGSHERRCTPALWAYRLAFPHPVTGAPLSFTAPLPETFPFSLFLKG